MDIGSPIVRNNSGSLIAHILLHDLCCLNWRNLIPLYAHYILLYTNSCHFNVYYTYYFHGNITDTHAVLLWKQQVYPSAPSGNIWIIHALPACRYQPQTRHIWAIFFTQVTFTQLVFRSSMKLALSIASKSVLLSSQADKFIR